MAFGNQRQAEPPVDRIQTAQATDDFAEQRAVYGFTRRRAVQFFQSIVWQALFVARMEDGPAQIVREVAGRCVVDLRWRFQRGSFRQKAQTLRVLQVEPCFAPGKPQPIGHGPRGAAKDLRDLARIIAVKET